MQSAILFLCLIVGALADGHERSCMSGSITYNDEMIVYDGSRHQECSEDQTSCYQITMQVTHMHSMQGEWQGTIVEGGCMNPEFEGAYNAGLEAAQAFNEPNVTVSSYDFQSCNDSSNCFDFRPQGSEQTVHCFSGVTIYDGENMVFSAEQVDECRVFETCDTVVVNQMGPQGQEMKYVYTGCGDPYNSIYDGMNVLPYVPPSTNYMERQQACQEFGTCYETIMGLCHCAYSVDTSQFGMVVGVEDKECNGDFCNGGTSFSGLSCFMGTVVEIPMLDQILFDDTHEKKCSASETQCWWMVSQVNVMGTTVRSSFGGCMNPDFRDQYDSGEGMVESFLPDGGVVESYMFDTCEDNNCNNYRPENSMPTIMCNTGLTVMDGQGNMLFEEQDKQQCRVHDSCETVTLDQMYMNETYHFVWTACGDPANTRTGGTNNMVPIVPTSNSLYAREMACEMLGNCTEVYYGLCLCPQDFQDPATTINFEKESCQEDYCNQGYQPFSCMTGNTIRDNESGMLLFDETMFLECKNGEDACWWLSVNSQTSDYNVNSGSGGCMFSQFQDQYDQGIEGLQQYYGDMVMLSDYEFNTCNDSECNNYRSDDSMETVMCEEGVYVKNNMDEVVFEFAMDRQCRVHDTCLTSMISKTQKANNETYHFTYTSCGDPFMTRPVSHILPIVPESKDMADTEAKCMEYGCAGLYLAVCVCPADWDFDAYAHFSELETQSCEGDYCNKQGMHMDPCASNPCNNLGSCMKTEDGHDYMCYCYDGSQGHSCDMPVSSGMWCMTGERVSMEVDVGGQKGWYSITNNAAHAACAPEDGMTCVHYVIEGTAFTGQAVRMDFGECISTYETVDCAPYQNSAGVMGFMNVESCETNQCSESYCNDFGTMQEGEMINMPDCRPISTDSELGMFDFRVFPNCSATELYHGMEKCVMQFGNQFPFYNNPDQCEMEADGMVKCMADLVQTCLSTNCPTMLDSVPGLRAEYHVIRFFASQINSMSTLIDTIFTIIPFASQQEQEMIRNLIGDPSMLLCIDPNNMNELGEMMTQVIGQVIQMVGGSLDLNDIMGQELASQFFCSNDLLTQIMQPAITMLPQLIESQSETDVCNTFVDFANNMISTVTSNCDFSRLGNFLGIFLPEDFPSEIFGVVQAFVPMIAQLQIPRCAEEYNACNYNPCNNLGVCQNHGDGHYTCYCYDGTSGYSCPGGMSNTACDSNPCNNMGSCSPMGEYDYMCYCYDGSSGHSCSGDMNPCDSSPCGQGSCMDNGGSYMCYCMDGTQGQYCQDMNPCDSSPCGQGSCMNNGGSYTCYCMDGSQGQYCQDMNPCDSSPCGQGSCMNNGGSYTCYCMDGSQGQYCQDHYNPCDSNPCNMQGSCMDHGDGHYTCYCYDGSQGQTCDGPMPSPTPSPTDPDQFNCEQYYAGTSACQMRKAWLCDYAQWRWTTLTVWLNQFHEYVHNTGHQLEMTMPTCNDENEQAACSNPEMHRCRYNEHMHCNECYCADHEYSNLEGIMDHWRHDYRAWATFFQEYRRVMQNNGGFGQNMGNDTC